MPELRPNSLGRALRGFFGDYLTAVRGNSRHAVLSYRDAFKLLLRFPEQRLGRPAATLEVPDLTEGEYCPIVMGGFAVQPPGWLHHVKRIS